MATKTTTPVSEKRNSNPTGCLVLFGLVFLLIGLGSFYAAVVRPLMQVNAAKSWTPVTATVTASSVRSWRSDKKTHYGVDVEYSFPLNGQSYVGNTYQFGNSDAGSYSNAQNQVAKLPVGATITAYANPANPNQSVVVRALPSDIWAGLFTLIFVAVGAGIVVAGVFSGRKSPGSYTKSQSWRPKSLTSSTAGTTPAVAPVTKSQTQLVNEMMAQGSNPVSQRIDSSVQPSVGGPVTLKPRTQPGCVFVFLLFFGLIWNGVIGTAMLGFFQKPSGPGIFMGLFMLPFVAVGLGVAALTIYQFLALFGPKVELTVAQAAVPIGGTLNVQWKLNGKQNVTKLQIYLEGREEATYRRGTDTYTDKNTFCVLDVTDAMSQPQAGSGSVQIPAGAMHSFEASNNKILWLLIVKGEIPIWPDIKEEYPIVVLPQNA